MEYDNNVKFAITKIVGHLDELTVLGFLSKYFGFIPMKGNNCYADLTRKMNEAETDAERNKAFVMLGLKASPNSFGLDVSAISGKFFFVGD